MITNFEIFENNFSERYTVICVQSISSSFTVGKEYSVYKYKTDQYNTNSRKVKDNNGKLRIAHLSPINCTEKYTAYTLASEFKNNITALVKEYTLLTTETLQEYRSRMANEKGSRFDL